MKQPLESPAREEPLSYWPETLQKLWSITTMENGFEPGMLTLTFKCAWTSSQSSLTLQSTSQR